MSIQRNSKKRDAIYSMLAGTKEHPSAEWVYAKLKPDIPDLSLGTVYRNLARFKEEGRAISVATVNGQERFDGCVEPHAHFICRCCGMVEDLNDMPIPPFPALDRTVEAVQLNYYGLCHGCKNSAQAHEKEGDC